MTTPDPETEDEVDEQPEKENPMFLISVDRLNRLERSPVHLVAGRLASTSPSKSKPVKELGDVRSLIREIAQNYKNDANFIRSDMPVQEIIFRTLLARGNRPMSLSDLHYELTERWATPIRPIVITEERLVRILDGDTYYGFERK
ncbi:MAG: hypothetical protein BZY87_03050 [SAR202 cluster bacterium Io17-Chloro-G6]|nr:MAG: hypothetical protein BZY87_03050 [SAR202 cluster bacterium Io17-Chloro-G6]